MTVGERATVAREQPAAARLEASTPRVPAALVALVERGDPIVALGLTWIVMLLVQNASANVIGIDGYYHIKMAWLMRQQGLAMDFPWLPLTILNPDDFTNHHLLYHILLIPFTFLADVQLGGSFSDGLRLAGKAASLVYGVLAIFTAYWVMTRLRVRFPLFWLLVLLASAEWFLGRQAMTRRQSVSLMVLLLASYLVVNGRYRWLLPLAFAYAWLFDGFVLLVAVVGLGFAARLVARRELAWPLLGWPLLGLALAVLLNPYFPNNVVFTVQHIIPKVVPVSEVRVGNEWYPYSLDVLWGTSWLAVVVVPLGLLALMSRFRSALRDPAALFLAAMAIMFLVLYLRSRRFVESEPAFAVLFCAYAWTHFIPRFRGRALGAWLPRAARIIVAIGLLVGVAYQVRITLREAQNDVKDRASYTTFQSASEFVQRNTPPGERIYQTDWDDFPELFFWNAHNTYIVGLDPTYMYLEDRELYMLWRNIGRGLVDRPSQFVRDQFQARYIITDRDHSPFIAKADADPELEIVHRAPNALVYRVKER